MDRNTYLYIYESFSREFYCIRVMLLMTYYKDNFRSYLVEYIYYPELI